MKQIALNINNNSYIFHEEMTVLQACMSIGLEIPKFCYHEKLTIAGNCRMCLIEIAQPKSLKPMASCAINIINDMVVFTNTMLVKRARESVLEYLLANHPLDCPICDQGGECDLQDQSMIYGSDRGRFYEQKRAVMDKECGPIIKTIMTRCIHCTRCVRFSEEIAGISSLGVLGRGSSMEIGFYVENLLESELSGNLIDLCPVGALTSKPYAFVARPWELKSFEVCDIIDSLGSRIRIDVRGLEVLRILPSINEELNEEWISDKTRFFYDALKKQRLYTPLMKYISLNICNKKNQIFVNVSWNLIFNFLFYIINQFNVAKQYLFAKNNIYCFFGNLVDVESLISLKTFANYFGSSFIFYQKIINNQIDFRKNFFLLSYKSLEYLDFCLIVNFNPRFEMPLLNLRLRKAFSYNNLFMVSLNYVNNLTYKVFQNITNVFHLYKIIEGKHFLNHKILFSNKIIFIFGQKFYYKFDFVFVQEFMNKYKSNLNVLKIFNFSSILNAKEFGLFYNYNFHDFEKFFSNWLIKYNLIFLLGTDFLNSNIQNFKNNFLIYQGHHADEQAIFSNVILPACTFLEKESFFFNLLGNYQKTKIVVFPPKMAREDWKILYNFCVFYNLNLIKNKNFKYKFLNYNNNSKQIFEFYSKLNLSNYSIDLSWYYHNLIKNFRFFIFKLNLYDFVIITNNFNFYKTDVLVNYSRTLSYCAKRYNFNQFNFQ